MHSLQRQVYMITQFKILRLLQSVKQHRLDEVGDLTGWVTDLWGSEPGCRSYFHSEGTPGPASVNLCFQVSNTGWHPIGLIQAFFRYFNTGPSVKLSSLRVCFLFVMSLHITVLVHYFCLMAVRCFVSRFMGKGKKSREAPYHQPHLPPERRYYFPHLRAE